MQSAGKRVSRYNPRSMCIEKYAHAAVRNLRRISSFKNIVAGPARKKATPTHIYQTNTSFRGEAGLNRPLTADEIMHIHNWHAGGESVWQLAEELRRSEQSIQKALNTPLTPEQRRNNQKNPYTRGTTE